MKRFTLLTLLLALLCQQGQAENWQYRLPDKTFLSVVSIPGSHDSATGSGWASLEAFGDLFARTQDLTIAEQWSLGVRAFDLRPCVYEDYLNINHGIMPTTLHFEDVMAQLRDSLIANPTEFVVIHMLHETDGDQVENAYNTRIQQVLQSDELKDYLVGFRRNLTVGDMRGKILILSRDKYASKPIGGFFQNWTGEANWAKQTQGKITGASTSSTYTANCYMQDYSDTHNAGGVDTKIEALTRLLDYSTTHKTSSVLSIVWVLNFMSAYSKVQSLFGTDVSTSEGYRDNASHTHAAMLDYLKTHTPGPTGIVLMDYAGVDESDGYATRGKELVRAIIENNFGYLDDVPVGIQDVNATATHATYDLSGRPVSPSSAPKSLYIRNGRKVIK
ncbi:MAG: hypothetical protein IJ197_02625 [Bacteroidaceae bacterium]|nr:hypothetical protein [Bacteroidaceae bacterium]